MLLRSVLLLAALLVSACGSAPLKETPNPEARQALLERLDQFRVTGGLGVWTDKESISTRIDCNNRQAISPCSWNYLPA